MKALHILSNLSGKTLFLPVLMVMLALTTSLAQAPANDLCSGATPIACGQTLTGSTLNATIDQAPACGLSLPKYGVWYSIVGTGGDITLSTCGGANWDTQIGVYSGSCAALTCVAGNNNFCGRQSTVTFTSTFGTTYYIWVTGVIDARGNFSLSATCANVAPPNDACANATALTCGQTVTGSTVGATADAVGTCTTALGTAPGVWYTLTPANSGSVTVSLCGSGYDTKLGVFSGTCGALVCVAGNDDFCSVQSQVSFTATAGTTYRILVTGYLTAFGSFTLSTTCPAGPPPPSGNFDDCTGAITLTPGATCVPTAGTTVGATQSIAPATCSGFTSSSALDVWYKFTATQANHVVIAGGGTTFDVIIQAFSGACNGTSLGCIDGQILSGANEVLSLSGLTPGQVYLIRIYGWFGSTGAFTVCVTNGATSLTAPTNTTAALAGEVVSLPDGDLTVGQVFPNPMVGSTANIRVDSPKETEAIVRFMDQMGREVMMIESDLNVGDNLLQLNISRLPAGTYFVMVQVEGKVIPRRLVVPRS